MQVNLKRTVKLKYDRIEMNKMYKTNAKTVNKFSPREVVYNLPFQEHIVNIFRLDRKESNWIEMYECGGRIQTRHKYRK